MLATELKESLTKLHIKLKQTKTLDEESKKILKAIARDITNILDTDQVEKEQHKSLVKKLEDSVEYFEVSHPQLTSLISRAINILDNMGI